METHLDYNDFDSLIKEYFTLKLNSVNVLLHYYINGNVIYYDLMGNAKVKGMCSCLEVLSNNKHEYKVTINILWHLFVKFTIDAKESFASDSTKFAFNAIGKSVFDTPEDFERIKGRYWFTCRCGGSSSGHAARITFLKYAAEQLELEKTKLKLV